MPKVTILNAFGWLKHILGMGAHRLSFGDLFVRTERGWKKRHGDQALTWRRSTKKLASVLALVDATRFSGWDPRDENCC